MTTQDWNPSSYLKFNRERIQPSIDLVARIPLTKPARIIDVGCGPGNSTQILRSRWPDSTILGVDNSAAMIEKAREDYPGQEWKPVDVAKEEIAGTWDIIFSNAVIQWIPDHTELFRKMKAALAPGGIIALQIPLFFDMPLGKAIAAIAVDEQWADRTASANKLFTIHNQQEYYDMLITHFDSVELWVTDYIHIMESHVAICAMIRSSGLRPYLDRLGTNDEKNAFEKQVLAAVREKYPQQCDGKVLFPFRRLFIIAGDIGQPGDGK